jgi:hypothetical protein
MDDQLKDGDQAPRRGLTIARCTAELRIEATEAERTLDRLTDKARGLRKLRVGVSPWRVVIDVLIVVLLGALVLGQYGCACGMRQAASSSSPQDQLRAALSLETACGPTGSAVIVDRTHALTAAHVIGVCPLPVLLIDSDGVSRVASLEAVAATDVARLELLPDEPPFAGSGPPSIARAAPGAGVCIESGLHHERRCGRVRTVSDGRGGVEHSAATIKGDSGSGLYDEHGRLVGIVVTCDVPARGGACLTTGGRATPLAPRAWIAAGGGS